MTDSPLGGAARLRAAELTAMLTDALAEEVEGSALDDQVRVRVRRGRVTGVDIATRALRLDGEEVGAAVAEAANQALAQAEERAGQALGDQSRQWRERLGEIEREAENAMADRQVASRRAFDDVRAIAAQHHGRNVRD